MKPHFSIPEPAGQGRPRASPWRFRLRTALLAIVVLAVGLSALRIEGMAALRNGLLGLVPLLLSVLGAVGLVLTAFLVLMGLGWLGFGLLALGDRFAGTFQPTPTRRWPDEVGPSRAEP